jgi:hypothetical protein
LLVAVAVAVQEMVVGQVVVVLVVAEAVQILLIQHRQQHKAVMVVTQELLEITAKQLMFNKVNLTIGIQGVVVVDEYCPVVGGAHMYQV